MSTSKSTTESSSSARTGSIPSSYFQTEFPVCCDGTSDIESSTISGTIVDESVDVSEKISMQICGLEKSLKKKVSISIQADRSIIGKEDSLPKERKRWIRPPVLGQASNNDNNVVSIGETTNTSDSEQEHLSKSSVKSKQSDFIKDPDYKYKKDNISDKTLEGSSDQSLPPGGDLSDFQRIPTPSSVSSVTSRPLEWDSGADVGYFQQYDAAQRPEIELSSIERIALDRGRSGVLKRSDPEGKSSTKKMQGNSTVVNIIGAPTSESTPLSSSSVQYNSRKQDISFDEKGNNNSKHQHLFPEIIIQRKGNESDSSCDLNKSRKLVCNEELQQNTSPLKKSSSLENLNDSKLPDRQNSTFPRSHSQLNLADNGVYMHNPQIEKIIHPPQSVSSSSIATVVTGSPHKNSKCIQTSYHKNNVATQSSMLDAENQRCKPRVKRPSENNSSTLESIQMSADDRVNSFEYLPGHIYENAQKCDDINLWETGAVSLKDDVERGVHLLEEFIQGSNANNTIMKKELLQRVVKRLIQTDYPEDDDSQNSIPLRCSTRRSQNRDEAIGESSSENIPPPNKKPSGNSTSLSGHSSSVWLSVTESSKSSDPIDPKIVNKKSASIKKRNVNEDEKRPQSTTDYSSDIKLDWKAPITKAEKLYENKKKGGKVENENKLFDFLNAERENQLDWIVQEIDHLSNLKSLLEKHEKLRRNLQRLKRERQMKDGGGQDVRPTLHQKQHGFRRKPLLGSDIPNRPPPAPIYPKEKKISTQEEAWDSHNYDTTDKQKLKKSVSTETRKEDIFGLRRATAYTITFENDQPKKKEKEPPEKPLIADRLTLAKETRERVRETYHLPSLQDYLLAKRPDIVNRAEIRRKTVAELSAVRQLRQDKRPEVLAAALSSGNSLMPPPPPPLVKRVVSQKEMREQTEKKYRQTFEVKKKISERKSRETLKTNRLMADMYNKRLQLLTLKGRTQLSNSIDVISTV